jgi:hypothetical protein
MKLILEYVSHPAARPRFCLFFFYKSRKLITRHAEVEIFNILHMRFGNEKNVMYRPYHIGVNFSIDQWTRPPKFNKLGSGLGEPPCFGRGATVGQDFHTVID